MSNQAIREAKQPKIAKILSEVGGIRLIEFVDENYPNIHHRDERNIRVHAPDEAPENLIEWIKTLLTMVNFDETIILIYLDREILFPAPYAKVHIDKNYDWLDQLWKPFKILYFWSLVPDHSRVQG